MFSPDSIASLSWWLDERDQVGSPVSDWGDQSSGGLNDLTQGTAANRPAVGSINGVAAPDFASTDWLDCARTQSQILSITDFTMYVVVQPDTVAALNTTTGITGNVVWGQAGVGGFIGLALQVDGAGTGRRAVFTANDGAGKNARSLDGSIVLGAANLIAIRMRSGTDIQCRAGASANQTTAFGTYAAGGNTQSQRLGLFSAGSTALDARVGSLIGYAAYIADGSAEDTSIRSYLSTKYGCAV